MALGLQCKPCSAILIVTAGSPNWRGLVTVKPPCTLYNAVRGQAASRFGQLLFGVRVREGDTLSSRCATRGGMKGRSIDAN